MKTITFIIFFIVIHCKTAYCQPAHADTAQTPHAYWLAGGLGFSSLGLELMANANAQIGRKWLLTGTTQIESPGFGSGTSLTSFNLLAGKISKRKTSLFCVSAGLGLVTFDYPRQVTLGIPVLLQTYWVIGQTFGLGLNATANLNTVTPTVGFSINIAIGSIATHH